METSVKKPQNKKKIKKKMSKRLEFFQVAYRNHPSTIHREKKRPALAEFVCLEIYSTCELQKEIKIYEAKP